MLPLEEAQFPIQGTKILQALREQLKKKKNQVNVMLIFAVVECICYFILTTNWCLVTIGLNVKTIMQNEENYIYSFLYINNPESHDSIHMTFWKR